MCRRLLLLTFAAMVAVVGLAVVRAPEDAPARTAAPEATPGGPYRLLVPNVGRDEPRRVSLAAVGDVMLARGVGRLIVAEGPGAPFAGVADVLRGVDVAVANLETSITERGEPAAKGYTFRAPPAAAEALALAGVDVVSLANNHAFDYGPDGLADTLALLSAQGIAAAGAGPDAAAAHAPALLTRNGLRIAFLSYIDVPVESGGFNTRSWEATDSAPGVAWLDIPRMAAGIAAARGSADLVVVLLHFGLEGRSTPTDTQRSQAHAAIDAGAALVIGHHPHVLQEAESYGGGLVVYSLGNFVFDGFDNPSNQSAILLVELTDSGAGAYRLVAVAIDAAGLPQLAGAD